MQAEILEKVAGVVKPGGKLVYATCSLFKEENEAQIEAFLKVHPEFTVQNVDESLGKSLYALNPASARHRWVFCGTFRKNRIIYLHNHKFMLRSPRF